MVRNRSFSPDVIRVVRRSFGKRSPKTSSAKAIHEQNFVENMHLFAKKKTAYEKIQEHAIL